MTEFAVFDVGKWPIVNVKLSGIPEDMTTMKIIQKNMLKKSL